MFCSWHILFFFSKISYNVRIILYIIWVQNIQFIHILMIIVRYFACKIIIYVIYQINVTVHNMTCTKLYCSSFCDLYGILIFRIDLFIYFLLINNIILCDLWLHNKKKSQFSQKLQSICGTDVPNRFNIFEIL